MAKKRDQLDEILESLDNDLMDGEPDEMQDGPPVDPADDYISDAGDGDGGQAGDHRPDEGPLAVPEIVNRQTVTRVDKPSVNALVAATADNAIMEMLDKIKTEFETISDTVLKNWNADRDQIQQVLLTLISAVGDNANQAEKHVVEGLVKLLDTKVNSGMLAVKMLEAKTKLLMALKSTGNVFINNQNTASVGGSNQELVDILSTPMESDI